MSRQIATVAIKVNTSACRLCGGSGRDPYSHGSACRKCAGRKIAYTPAGRNAQVAWDNYKMDLAQRDTITQDDLAAAVAFIGTLRGATAEVTYTDELV